MHISEYYEVDPEAVLEWATQAPINELEQFAKKLYGLMKDRQKEEAPARTARDVERYYKHLKKEARKTKRRKRAVKHI